MLRLWSVAVLTVGIVAVLAACARTPSVDRDHEASSPELVGCAAEQTRLHVHHRVFPETRMAAKDHGISVEEVPEAGGPRGRGG